VAVMVGTRTWWTDLLEDNFEVCLREISCEDRRWMTLAWVHADWTLLLAVLDLIVHYKLESKELKLDCFSLKD
jgi:hypothetical protein